EKKADIGLRFYGVRVAGGEFALTNRRTANSQSYTDAFQGACDPLNAGSSRERVRDSGELRATE
ncbi:MULTISPECIES: hypothetical protein, partial [Mycobacterium tuberculosis complex]|uniref:hypothetical protein n=2 Tax=Mycobacterium tuberculosis complex TaxID=77643 RepID=UPI000B3284C9